MSLIAANHVFRHAYCTSAAFREEHALLLSVVRAVLANAQMARLLYFEYRRSKAFDIILPCVLEYLDAPSLVAAELTCTAWAHECRRTQETLWEHLLQTKFQVTARQFRRRSHSMGGAGGYDGKDADNVSARELYKFTHQKLRLVLRGGAVLPIAPCLPR